MNALAKFYIGTTELTENPEGWEDFLITLRFDRELKGLFSLAETSLTFWEDGYDLIKAAFDTHGYCYTLPFEIRKWDEDVVAWVPIFTGTIFLKDCEFTEGIEGFSVKAAIQDNSFFAKIYNNRNLKAKIYVGKSKNNVSISPAAYTRVQYFSSPTGMYYSMPVGAGFERNNTAFKVYDVLKYFIDFMSDGTMDFVSDTFGPGGKYENYVITNGYTTRFATYIVTGITQDLFETNWDVMSFQDVFTELDKEFNIGFVAGFNGSRAYMRIEEFNYLFPSDAIENLESLDKFKQKAASEYLYDKMIIGSGTVTDEPTFTSFPANIRFIGFVQEEYIIAGECNTDRSLDLVNKWIIDTDTIEDLVENGFTTAPTQYDKTFILIQGNFNAGSGGYYEANKSNWLDGSATPLFYNELLNTNNKTNRYLGAVPNAIVLQLGVIDNTFNGIASGLNSASELITTTNPVLITEINDPNNNFNSTTHEYVAPKSGTYSFTSFSDVLPINIYPGNGAICYCNVQHYLDVYDSGGITGGVLKYSIKILDFNPPFGTGVVCGNHLSLTGFGSLNLTAADTVVLRLVTEGYNNTALHIGTTARTFNTTFACTQSVDGGGVYVDYDPQEFPVIRSTFTGFAFTNNRFKAIQADPRGLISFGVENGKTYFGHIEEWKFKPFRETLDGVMLSNEKVNQ